MTGPEWRELLAEQLHVSVETLADDTLLVEDLDADSLDFIELVMKIEEITNTEINDADVEAAYAQGRLRTVRDTELWVLKHLRTRTRAS